MVCRMFCFSRDVTELKDATNVTKGIATRSKDATGGAPGLTTRNKKLLVPKALSAEETKSDMRNHS